MLWLKKTKKNSAQAVLGLSIGEDQLTLCRIDGDVEAPKLLGASLCPIAKGQSWSAVLGDLVRSEGLKGLPCRIVLNSDDYKLLPAETPVVPEAELDQALLWSLREVLEAPPHEMVVQSFPFAAGLNRPGRAMRHVVAARKNRIQALVKGIQDADLELDAIDIPELALRNIAMRLPENNIGLGFVSQGAHHVVITLYRGDELYVTRQLAGIASLGDAGHPLTAPRLAEQLGLDLLRTLDYYDSQLQQRPPAAIYLQPLPGETSGFIDNLAETLRLPIKQLRFADILPGAAPNADVQAAGISALGAALRRELA